MTIPTAPSIDPAIFAADWRWPNFQAVEFRCHHTGLFLLVPSYLDALQALRTRCGFPFVITSGYRHPTHPVEAAKARPGAHATGRAVDIAVAGEDAYRLVALAAGYGFTGIGIAQRGQSRFVHLDTLTADEFHAPRPALWSY